MRILIVCVGNICRSPMAEAVLRRRLPRVMHVSSAGLAARVGDGVHPVAAEVMHAHGLATVEHVARQFTRALCADTDLVLTMERRHAQAVFALAPEVRPYLHLLGRWDGQREIRDPCGKSREHFEETFDAIEYAAKQWCERITS